MNCHGNEENCQCQVDVANVGTETPHATAEYVGISSEPHERCVCVGGGAEIQLQAATKTARSKLHVQQVTSDTRQPT